jgi:hypothetical protein
MSVLEKYGRQGENIHISIFSHGLGTQLLASRYVSSLEIVRQIENTWPKLCKGREQLHSGVS